MIPLANPAFAEAGALPGEARGWTFRSRVRGQQIAPFGPAPAQAWEGFERWSLHWSRLTDVTVVLAFFDARAEGLEDFEEGWANTVYLYEMPPAQLALLSGAPESWESGWRNDTYARDWSGLTASTASFGGAPRESFEVQWRGNENFIATWAGVTASVASFDPRAQPLEDFENGWTRAKTV